MWGGDRASAGMGMSIVDVDEGSATLTKTVLGEDVNGHGICHGGVIFSLADSAFAFACNSRKGHGRPAQRDQLYRARAGRRPPDRHRARGQPDRA